jgi:hypothetical protein
MLRTRVALFSLAAFSTVACDSKKETATPPAAVVPPPANGTAPTAAPAAAAPSAAPTTGFVVFTTVLKREGSDAPKVADAKGKQVANWLATLYRGERVTIGKEEGEYIQAKTSGEVEGFVKKSSLLIAPDVSEATVIDATDAFDRPDLLALNSKKKINPGTLLFVVKNREQFSEVNASGASTIWVLNGKITTDANEIAVAKLLAKARSLKDAKKGEGVADLVGLAKSNFAEAKLVAVMETELAAPPAEGAVAADGAAPAAAGAAAPAGEAKAAEAAPK